MGLVLESAAASNFPEAPKVKAQKVRQQADVMLNVFIAGTQLYLGWKKQLRDRIQQNVLLATAIVESVSPIAANAYPAASAAVAPLGLLNHVLRFVFAKWNAARTAEECAINDYARMYLASRVAAALAGLSERPPSTSSHNSATLTVHQTSGQGAGPSSEAISAQQRKEFTTFVTAI